MQDALLCYYIVANMLHAGYFADAVKLVRQACALCRGLFAGAGPAQAPARSATGAPVLFGEMEAWVERLTRMESYVASMA